MAHKPTFGKTVYELSDIQVGTVLTYSNVGGQLVRVRVTDLLPNVEGTNREGFCGYVVEDTNFPKYTIGSDDTIKDAYINVWGYVIQIEEIHSNG